MFFELEDIKRRHSLYWDIYNVESWVTPPDSTLSWNYQRGAMVGLTSQIFQESWTAFQENWRLLLRKYEPPANAKQFFTFTKEVLKMENYTRSLKNRTQYASCIGLFDVSSKIAAWRWINGGWQKAFGGFEFNHVRKILPSVFISFLTAPISIPFEMARLTYYADKTYPKELQRGYSSYFNALHRIPFEEGPYWLFKNTLPIFMKNFFQTLTMFFTFDFMKDKLSWMWRVGDVPYYPVKIFAACFSSYLACVFSYPWAVTIKQMVDLWPKEKGGICTFDNNYRKAAVWLWYHDFGSNYFPGLFNNYVWRCFPGMVMTLMLADSFGIFNNQQIDLMSGQGTNSWEDVPQHAGA